MTMMDEGNGSDAISTGIFTGFIAGWCSCMVLFVGALLIGSILVYAIVLNH